MNQKFIFVVVILSGCFYIVGQHIAADSEDTTDHILTVQATGIAKNTPNIAHITLGVQIQPQQTAQQATDILGNQINPLIVAVKSFGIADADIKILGR